MKWAKLPYDLPPTPRIDRELHGLLLFPLFDVTDEVLRTDHTKSLVPAKPSTSKATTNDRISPSKKTAIEVPPVASAAAAKRKVSAKPADPAPAPANLAEFEKKLADLQNQLKSLTEAKAGKGRKRKASEVEKSPLRDSPSKVRSFLKLMK